MKPEEAYSYRSFEHHKRETFVLIAKILDQLKGKLRILDLGCGPAVLEGIAQSLTGGRISEAWLVDFEPDFLAYARAQLEGVIPKLNMAQFDMNAPAQLPDIATPLSAVVSVNALFHADRQNLHAIYRYCFDHLSEGGVLVNHQTFGCRHGQLFDKYCGSLDSVSLQDPLDAELMRRSHLDTKRAGGPVSKEGSGGYRGLALEASEHLAMLRDIGFDAEEVWRKGKSAMILAERPGHAGKEKG